MNNGEGWHQGFRHHYQHCKPQARFTEPLRTESPFAEDETSEIKHSEPPQFVGLQQALPSTMTGKRTASTESRYDPDTKASQSSVTSKGSHISTAFNQNADVKQPLTSTTTTNTLSPSPSNAGTKDDEERHADVKCQNPLKCGRRGLGQKIREALMSIWMMFVRAVT